MEINSQAVLARIFTNGNAMAGDRHLSDVILERAHQATLAGATVLKGSGGFGRSHRFHGSDSFDLSDDKPIIVEIVEEEEKLRSFILSLIDLRISLVTLERVEIAWVEPTGRGRAR
jgi:PII-like signaling protein